jgi:hypothetical protein
MAGFSSGCCRQVFDNFGPDQTYSLSGSWRVQGRAAPGGYEATANAFICPRSGHLCHIFLAVSLLSGSNLVDVHLMTDAANRPTAVLESWRFNGQIPPFGTQSFPIEADSVKRPMLQAKTRYWLAVVAGAPDTRAGWNQGLTGPKGMIVSSSDGASWSYMNAGQPGAFRIDVR